MSNFLQRLEHLPLLGLGVSTEYGAMLNPNALNLQEARQAAPHCIQFLELGIEASKGLDMVARQWIQDQLPCTYHFLDINLNESEDFNESWLAQVQYWIDYSKPAWLCGDAGLWHLGPRAQGHMLLLPPILTRESAYAFADGICRLRDACGLEVLPENPPGHVYVGDLHIMDFFAIVCERADTGMLLDAAHLAIYQQQFNLPMSTALDRFPLDRIVELHMAGGAWKQWQGLDLIEDEHCPTILEQTWDIFDTIAPALSGLKAVVFECEHNPWSACAAEMQKLHQRLCERLDTTHPMHTLLQKTI